MRRISDAFIKLGDRVFVHGVAEDGGAIQVNEIRIIFSWDEGWDHVSVSLPDRCPTWEEMEWVKRAFFRDTETAMQLHVPISDHISFHPYCLHLWRPQRKKIPRPPAALVGGGTKL